MINMSYWLIDPELFLYAKGTGPDDVLLRRCKKPASSSSSSSSLVVPMKSDDFDFVKIVKNHLELIGYMFDWDEPDYKRLVKYIYENRLLVNSQGFVIVELHKTDEDGNKMVDDANEEVPAIYIRSLDVLALKPYIPKLRERPIPLRRVQDLQVMEDVDGKPAVMEKDFTIVTKLTARVDDLEGKVTKLTADLVTQMNALTILQQEVKNINANTKEAWMNNLTNSDWVGVEGLNFNGADYDIIVLGQLGTFTVDDSSTNVRAKYWYKIKTRSTEQWERQAIFVEDLTPNKEMARFSKDKWWISKSKGKTYVNRIC